MAGPAIRLLDFGLAYPTPDGQLTLLRPSSFDITTGSLALIVGPSGSGKSSLFSAFLGLDDPYAPELMTTGTVELLGVPVRSPLGRAHHGRVGAVFQEGALLDDRSPRDNIALAGREILGRKIGNEEVQSLLDRVGLPDPPTTIAALSGGQRRRIALARALAGDPELLFLDEPTAGLDPEGAQEIAQLIGTVHRDRKGATTVVITHDREAFQPVATHWVEFASDRSHLRICENDAGSETGRSTQFRSRATQPPATQPPALDPPIREPRSRVARLRRTGQRLLLACASGPATLGDAIRNLIPVHGQRLLREISEFALPPAPYLALAALTLGGFGTYFAFQNNPLEGAFQHEVLVGTGKVLTSVAVPLLVCVLLSARIAASATTRIGMLRHARVFEALPLMGIRPGAFWLTPLLWGTVVAFLLHSLLAGVAGTIASAVVVHAMTGLSSFAWSQSYFAGVHSGDLQWIGLKALASAVATAIISYTLATRPQRSTSDVARAADRALVHSTLAVLLIHAGFTVVQFGR